MRLASKLTKKFVPFLEILKLKGSLVDVSTILVTGAFTGTTDQKIILAILSGAMIHSGGDIINDIYDIEIDRICKPKAPIPSGRMSIKTAWLYLTSIVGAALYISILLSRTYFILQITGILTGYILYSHPKFRFKDIPTLSIAIIALYFFLESLGVWSIYSPISKDALIVATYVFFLTFSLVFMKDFRDVDGDINSLPIMLGVRRAAIVSSILCLIPLILLGALYIIYGWLIILIASLVFAGLISFCLRILLFGDPVSRGRELKNKMILALTIPNILIFALDKF